MSRYFIVEVKDKHVTRHEIFLALVEKLGLGVVVTVEPASQQSFAPDPPSACEDCGSVDEHIHYANCPRAKSAGR